MKCEICSKEILSDSQFIDGKYYHNKCITQLESNWNELKKWLEDILKEYQNELRDTKKDDIFQIMNLKIAQILSNILFKMQELEDKDERRIFETN